MPVGSPPIRPISLQAIILPRWAKWSQELADGTAFRRSREDENRVYLRGEARGYDKQLVETAQQAGVETPVDLAVFRDHGYRGGCSAATAPGTSASASVSRRATSRVTSAVALGRTARSSGGGAVALAALLARR